jgi:hypothetical protein
MESFNTYSSDKTLKVGDTYFTIRGLWRVVVADDSKRDSFGCPLYTLEFIRPPVESDFKPIKPRWKCWRCGCDSFRC